MSDILNGILDSSIDDLNDLPEFKVYPPGVHRVSIELGSKKVNDHPCVELKMSALETIELADSNDIPLAAGDEGVVLYMMDNEFGQGKLKTIIKPIAAHLGVYSIREVVEGSKGMECIVTTKIRKNKDKTESYTDVTKIEVD